MGDGDYFTIVRPDVFREIQNRGKKSGQDGTQVGWGTNVDTLVLQKNRLKMLSNGNFYTSLLDQIVKIDAAEQQQQQPAKKPRLEGQVESELLTKWYMDCQFKYNDGQLDELPPGWEPRGLKQFIRTEAGEMVRHFSRYLKNKL